MKKAILTLFAMVAVAVGSMAQETGKIYFIAKDSNSKSFIDKKIVCLTDWKYFSIHEVIAGKHQVDVQVGGKEYKANDEPFFVDVEAGKAYYIRVTLVKKGLGYNLSCEEVTENTAKMIMKEMKGEDTNCFK